jgi:hypothetical protein
VGAVSFRRLGTPLISCSMSLTILAQRSCRQRGVTGQPGGGLATTPRAGAGDEGAGVRAGLPAGSTRRHDASHPRASIRPGSFAASGQPRFQQLRPELLRLLITPLCRLCALCARRASFAASVSLIDELEPREHEDRPGASSGQKPMILPSAPAGRRRADHLVAGFVARSCCSPA